MAADEPVPWPGPTPAVQVRTARPTGRLDEVVAFYREGLGLPELGRFEGHDGYDGVMLGLPDAGHHLEFTSQAGGGAGDSPTREHLLVLYFASAQERDSVADRLTGLGHLVVESENSFWGDNGGVEIADPDGYGVILMPAPSF